MRERYHVEYSIFAAAVSIASAAIADVVVEQLAAAGAEQYRFWFESEHLITSLLGRAAIPH